jgi:hypothetical protein
MATTFFFKNGSIATFTKIGKVDDTNLFKHGTIYSNLSYFDIVDLVAVGIVTGNPILGTPTLTRELKPLDDKRKITLKAENRFINLESENRFINLKAENRFIKL